jgi:hypothetical protein
MNAAALAPPSGGGDQAGGVLVAAAGAGDRAAFGGDAGQLVHAAVPPRARAPCPAGRGRLSAADRGSGDLFP